MADVGSRNNLGQYRRLLHILAEIPGPALLTRGSLEVAAGHVEAARVPEDVMQRVSGPDTKPRRADGHDQSSS